MSIWCHNFLFGNGRNELGDWTDPVLTWALDLEVASKEESLYYYSWVLSRRQRAPRKWPASAEGKLEGSSHVDWRWCIENSETWCKNHVISAFSCPSCSVCRSRPEANLGWQRPWRVPEKCIQCRRPASKTWLFGNITILIMPCSCWLFFGGTGFNIIHLNL